MQACCLEHVANVEARYTQTLASNLDGFMLVKLSTSSFWRLPTPHSTLPIAGPTSASLGRQ